VEGSFLSAGILLSTAVLYLSLATAVTAYPAAYPVQPWNVASSTLATATLLDCSRTPFVSFDGVGRWWQCNAAVRLSDGTTRLVRTGAGVASPRDAAGAITLVATCSGPKATGRCSYTRPGSVWAQVGIRVVWLLSKLVLGIGVFMGLFMAAMTVFHSYVLFMAWWRRPRTPRPRAAAEVAGDAAEGVGRVHITLGLPEGVGRVHVTLGLPEGVWGAVISEQMTPLVKIDDQVVEVTGWNTTTTVTLPAGRHRVRVNFGWDSIAERGDAKVSFDLRDGEDRRFRYEPRKSFNYGRIWEMDE